MHRPVPIAILTDFGIGNPYTPQMVSVIKSISPTVEILFTYDRIEFANILQARFFLMHFMKYLPTKCVVVCVVDPGVGTKRRILNVESVPAGRGQVGGMRNVLAPDNGILSDVSGKFRSVENKSLFAPNVSATFHGRDIFAPVAARLAAGLSPSKLGPRVTTIKKGEPMYEKRGADISGKVVFIDSFGNCVTSVPTKFGVPSSVSIRDMKITRFVRTYSDGKSKSPFIVAGSFGTFEIACNKSSAVEVLKVKPGDEVLVSFRP